jgi:hypothetical protein
MRASLSAHPRRVPDVCEWAEPSPRVGGRDERPTVREGATNLKARSDRPADTLTRVTALMDARRHVVLIVRHGVHPSR